MSHWQDGLVSQKSQSGWEDGLVQPSTPTSTPTSTPAPSPTDSLQSKGISLPADTTISPWSPSILDRVKELFSHIPAVNPNVKPGTESFIAPQELMTPAEQGRHPVLTATGEVASGVLSPGFLTTWAATGGLGTLPGAAGKILPRLVSLGFSADMLHGAYNQYQAVRDSMDRGDSDSALYHLTHMIFGGVLAGLAGKHAATGSIGAGEPTTDTLPGEPPATQGEPLSPAEHAYVNSLVQANLRHGMETENDSHIDQTVSAAKEFINASSNRPNAGLIQQVPNNASPLEGGPPSVEPRTGPEGTRPPDASLGGEETLRHDSGITGGEGSPTTDIKPGADTQTSGGPTATGTGLTSQDLAKLWGTSESDPGMETNRRVMLQGPAEVATLGAVSQLHETLTGSPINLANEAGEMGNGSVITRDPAISRPVDTDLANGGVTVIRDGKDLGIIARYLGSISQGARLLGNPDFRSIADSITDATISTARNTRDAINSFRSSTRSIITPDEWSKQVVPLLNNPDITPDNLSPDLSQNIRTAYLNERARLSQDRLDIINSKRKVLTLQGMSPDKAAEVIPDTWGIKEGYYHHAFPGNWTIMSATPEGTLEPIDTGWRQVTFDAAHAKAQEYLASNPDAQLTVRLDQATLPGKGVTDKVRLQSLMDQIRDASTLLYNGQSPDGILADLEKKAATANYAPRNPTQRTHEAILPREANLPGWADDIDNYERYIQGIERYKVLAPARQQLMDLRNKLAEMSGMPQIQRIGDMPRRYSGQYANILGRTDASIEALEGYPTALDAALRNQLQQWGHDPNMVDRAYSFVNSAEALLKLGFSPASAGLHLAQTVAATYPVLGERWTLAGILNSYSPQHADLVHDLGIEATSNLLDIDTFNAYKGGYFNTPGLGSKLAGAYKVLQNSGLFLFSKGIETARRVAAIGAYEKAINDGMSPLDARNYARDTLVRTQFMYSPADAPLALRVLPRPLTQFRTFQLKMMEYVTGLRGVEIPRFLLAMGAIGYAGLPALTALATAVEKVTGYNPEQELKKSLPRASRGVLGLLGIDYTKNIGFSDWLGSRSLDPSHLLGPAGSDLLGLGKAALASLQGPSRQGSQDIQEGLRNISPEARRLWDESTRLAEGNSSLTDPRGRVIIKNLTPGERLELATGLTPIRVAEERDAHERILQEISAQKDKRGYFVDKLASMQLEMMRGDLNEQQRMDLVAQTAQLSKMAEDYNVGRGLPKAVRDRAKEMFQERLQGDVKHAPKSIRPQVFQELGGSE